MHTAPPLSGGSPAQITQAIEENTIALLLTMGRAGGGEERQDAFIHWTIGGSPIDYHNCVVRANLPPQQADDLIAQSVARFQALGVPGTWHIGPSMRPHDLGARLKAHGFDDDGTEPGMAIDLAAAQLTTSAPDDLQFARVTTDEMLADWVATLARGFGEGPREAEWVGEIYARLGYGDETPWRHYLALQQGIPVATATMFLAAGAAGIYFVFTVPQARRQGIGAAITLGALHDAKALGYRYGVLGSSAMGYPVYHRLGFRTYCQFSLYSWHD